MRNLKKILSLVLCMAMMLSVMVVGAGAAFSDQKQIKNTEAVDMCSALNIINGYTDGSFKPEGTITRAEACKMICIALNGGQDPVLGTNATPTFTDIKGHWAEKYIEYCVSLGIVAGVGGGKFAPNATVTGSQFAKMLLIAMGYSADTENFTGSAWEVNVNVRASQKDLYEDLATMDPSVALTRDNAAQMLWNALNADMVEYDYKLSTVNGTLTSEMVVKDTKDQLLEKKYKTLDTEETSGILTKVEYDEDDAEYTYTVGNAGKFVSETNYVDLLGHNVCFVVKDNADKDVYGAFADDSAVITSGLYGDIEVDTTDMTMEIDDVEYDLESDYQVVCVSAKNHIATYGEGTTAPYFEFTAIDNDDNGDIDLIMVQPFQIAEISYVGADYVKVTGNSSKLENEDYTIYDGVEKEDIAIISDDMTLVTLGTITELEEQEGTVSACKSETAVIGGETYDYTQVLSTSEMKDYLDEDINFYAVNGYLVWEVEADASVDLNDFALVVKIASAAGLTDPQAKLLFTDGTEAVVDLAKDYAKANNGGIEAGDLVVYDIDDGEYELAVATADDLADFDAYDLVANETDSITWTAAESASDANAKITVDNQKAKFAADAVVFVYDAEDDEYTVETGATMAKVTDADANVLCVGADKNSNNALAVTFAYIETSGVSSSDALYGYVVSEVSSLKDSDGEYETATIWNGSKEIELTTADGEDFDDAVEGSVITYKLDADGAATDVEVIDNVAALTVIDGEYVTIDGVEYEIDEDTVILYVDADEEEGVANGSLRVADETEDEDVYYENVSFYDDDNDKVLELLVVDIDNDWYGVQ